MCFYRKGLICSSQFTSHHSKHRKFSNAKKIEHQPLTLANRVNNVIHLYTYIDLFSVWYKWYFLYKYLRKYLKYLAEDVEKWENVRLFLSFFLCDMEDGNCRGVKRLAINSKEKYIQIFAFSVVCGFYRKRERFLFAGNDSHFAGSSRFYEVISSFDLSQVSCDSPALSATISGKWQITLFTREIESHEKSDSISKRLFVSFNYVWPNGSADCANLIVNLQRCDGKKSWIFQPLHQN